MNGHFENSSSSSSNSSATYSSINLPSDTQLSSSSTVTSAAAVKPYKPKFHNYKKLDIVKAAAAAVSMTPLSIAATNNVQCQSNVSTPSTPLTPSFFGSNHAQLVSAHNLSCDLKIKSQILLNSNSPLRSPRRRRKSSRNASAKLLVITKQLLIIVRLFYRRNITKLRAYSETYQQQLRHRRP